MDKKQMTKRYLSLFLALIMLIGIMPMNIFAEVKKADWNIETVNKTATSKESWPLSKNNELVRVSEFEPKRTPSISYVGTYTNSDGREVIRLTYNLKQTSVSSVWKNLVLKFPKEFIDAVDWKYSKTTEGKTLKTGMYKGLNTGARHDYYRSNQEIQPFSQLANSESVFGAEGIYYQDLNNAGNNAVAYKTEIPMDFVLNEGKSIKDFKTQILIQARLMDDRFERVFARASDKNPIASYNAYTFTTVIPLAGTDYKKELNNFFVNNTTPFDAATSYVTYDLDAGIIDVIYKQSKAPTGSSYGGARNQENPLGFRQSVEASFLNILDDTRANGTVAEVTILDNTDKPYGNNNGTDPSRNIFLSKNDFTVKDDLAFLQIGAKEWKSDWDYASGINTKIISQDFSNTVLNSTLSPNSGLSTRVRYYVKTDVLNKIIKENGLKSYAFYSAIVNQDSYGTTCWTTQADEDIILKAGEKVNLKFNDNQGYKIALTYYDPYKEITIGKDQYSINFRENIEVQGAATGSNAFKEFIWTVPVDIKIPRGETISLRGGYNGELNKPLSSQTLTMVINNRSIEFTNPVLEHKPRVLDFSPTLTGGALVQTIIRPRVEEVFTDSKEIIGYSYYDRAEMAFRIPTVLDNENKLLKQTISASNVGEEVIFVENGENVKYTGYKFMTSNPNIAGAEQLKQYEKFKLPEKLEKDMPISINNRYILSGSIEGEDVIEQVQAKVTFDLNGQESKVGGFDTIEKIAPLNINYKYDPSTGEENPDYVPSGFTGDNVKFDDHRGEKLEGDDLKLRQMPTKEDINVPQGKRILGWTTKKLTDIPGGKTAAEQFRELDKTIRDLNEWNNVDVGENYIFDEKSPIDKERTVYAVYGEGINIILHSNNTADSKNETIVRIPITVADIDATNKLIDATTSPTLMSKKGEYVAKQIPKVPYANTNGKLEGDFEDSMKTFNMPNYSFIGWTADRFTNDPATSVLRAGNNNERIGEMEQGIAKDNGKTVSILKRTEAYSIIKQNKFKSERSIPNGFSVSFEGRDQNFANLKAMIEEGNDIHLYANYRPFFDVEVVHSFKNIDPKQDITKDPVVVGEYVDNVDQAKKHDVKVGLLYRTAVTDYGTPTVHADANYYPLKGQVKQWTVNGPNELKWKVPGFDEVGKRRSYVSAIVTDEDAYNNFTKDNWGALGIKTYVRVDQADGTALRDANAPLNIHHDAGNPYGDKLAKDQSYNIGVDAYTSATSRKSITKEVEGLKEVTGYTIYNTSTPVDIPKPVFNPVKDTDVKFELKWSESEQNADIKKIKLNIPGTGEVVLEKQPDGTYTKDGITASVQDGKLVVGDVDLSGQEGKEIVASYIVEKSGQEIEGPTGRIVIEEQKTSTPVDTMRQIENDPDGKPQIKFYVPNPTLNKPNKGTQYIAEVFNGKSWDAVGEYLQAEDNEIGTEKVITLDGVNNGDIIRITTIQPGQIPADSTLVGNGPYTPEEGQENKKYVKLDTQGPVTNFTAKDEEFRRFIDLTGTLDEITLDRKITVEIGTAGDQGTEGNETHEFEIKVEQNKEIVSDYINEVVRTAVENGNTPPTMWIIAKDQFGNKSVKEVAYTPTYVCQVEVLGARAGRKFVRVFGNMENINVVLTVTGSDGQEKATGRATIANTSDSVKLTFDNNYKLQSGDIVKVFGSVEKDGKLYTTNPLLLDIE
ncbi:hypothetical protein HKO22_04980 [Peptoniphilus sp. AGMB00490]|uniref:Uncharacterized protein n=1 Tax=Peptoniphilus faecalis TaxID=2731255 RepID=A0A848RIR5_9FIRM|nr:hypothetical protein [Peptoniphilus faecalis]NMW85096.1 hypothetical protein [Peptoniphilus faecalis]